MRYRNAESVREALLDNLFAHIRSFERIGKEQAGPLTVPCDLPTAVLMLREALLAEHGEFDGARRRREAFQHVERLLHEQIIDPMMTEAMESPGATERAIGLAAAQLMQVFLTKSVVINARITTTLPQKGMAGVDVLPSEEIKELLGMGDRVSKLYRELDRCRQSTINVIQVAAVPQPKPLALPSFD